MDFRARSESPMAGNYRSESLKNSEAYCPLFNANNARRRAEQDSILLANRIRLLRLEEDKAKKKIRETEQKTKEVLDMRRHSEEKRLAKTAEESRREAFEQELRAKANRDRQDQQRRLHAVQREVLSQKVAASASVKQERESHKIAIQQEQQEAEKEAAARAAQVRKELAAGERRRARSEGARLSAHRGQFQEKVAREEEAYHERVDMISRMEREEADLIHRLQRTQEQHKAVYAQLEDAISGASAPSRSSSALDGPLGQSQAATPSAASRVPLAASSSSASATEPRASRPPRPRAAATPTPATVAAPAVSSAATKPRPTSASRAASVPTRLESRSQGNAGKPGMSLRGNSAASICSTASGGPSPESGHSTPCSAAAPPPLTYTTADGLQINIAPEEELDLDKLLSDW